MDNMQEDYAGSLTLEQRASIDSLTRSGVSVRETAKITEISYGKVRHYVEWEAQCMPDLIDPPSEGPKILFFDIETSPQTAMGFFHKKYQVNINDIVRYSHFLCYAYKWAGQDEVGLVSQRHDLAYSPGTENDLYVARRLHKQLSQADIVVAHYGDRFDIPYANERFLYHDLGPTTPFQSIDTKAESSRHFKAISHSLADRTHKHGLSEKLKNSGWSLWIGCLDGDEESWDEMETYNIADVAALEDWYYKIRPWIGHNGKKKHPNMGHYWRTEEPLCPNCGSPHLLVRGWTPHRTQHYEYATMLCDEKKGGCGHFCRQAGVRRRIEPEDRIYAV